MRHHKNVRFGIRSSLPSNAFAEECRVAHAIGNISGAATAQLVEDARLSFCRSRVSRESRIVISVT